MKKIIASAVAGLLLALGVGVALATPAQATTNVVTHLTSWDTSDTRSAGHLTVVASGLHVWTDDSSSNAKVAGYYPRNLLLTSIGTPTLDWVGSTPAPGLQVVIKKGADTGILVGESVYGDKWWLSNGASVGLKSSAPHHGGGYGSDNWGTLAEWASAVPGATVTAVGFSLGSGIKGDGIIKSMTFGTAKFTFVLATPTVITMKVVNTPDDGCPTWARSTFTRKATITDNGDRTWKVVIEDTGTFATQPGAKTPDDATKTVATAVVGTITGRGEFTVTGDLKGADLKLLDGATIDNGKFACKANVPVTKSTSGWWQQFFRPGATATGITKWKWTYATCGGKGETRVEEDGKTPVGNIRGVACPTTPATTAPVKSAPKEELPLTGPSDQGPKLMILGGAGLLAVVLGGIALVVTRRRRDAEFFAAE